MTRVRRGRTPGIRQSRCARAGRAGTATRVRPAAPGPPARLRRAAAAPVRRPGSAGLRQPERARYGEPGCAGARVRTVRQRPRGTEPPGPYGDPYGNAPAYNPVRDPRTYGAPPARPSLPPPKEVVWATYAMYASIAFSIVNLIVTLADSTGYKNAIRDADPNRRSTSTPSTRRPSCSPSSSRCCRGAVRVPRDQPAQGQELGPHHDVIVVGVFTLLGLLGLGGDAPGIARLFGIIVLLANAATIVLLAIRRRTSSSPG